MGQWLSQSIGCSNAITHPGTPHVMVFPRVGMVSTRCLTAADGSSKLVWWLLANSQFGQALTLMLLTVVLVPSNCMIMMALVQLGIWNDYSKHPFLMKLSRELQQAQSMTTWQTESRGHLIGFWGKLIWCYQTNRIQSLEPSGLKYLYFLWGRGRSLS